MPALHANFLSGQTTDAPLLAAATVVNSAAFANLPEVVAPDYMWVTLDPEGFDGPPEVVKVTAHAATATVVAVERAQQDTTARDHPVTTVWVHAWTKGDVEEAGAQVGDIKSSVRNTLPGWLKLDGTVIPNADVAYPSLWQEAPGDWKSGSTLTLPNMSGRVLRGDSLANVGSLGGSDTHTLLGANLPSHTHTIDHTHSDTGTAGTHGHTVNSHTHTINHDHPAVSTSIAGNHAHTVASHSHTISHDHPAVSTSAGGAHVHPFTMRSPATVGTTGGAPPQAANQGSLVSTSDIVLSAGNHAHTVNVPAYSGSSGAAAPITTTAGNHTHTVNVPAFSGSSGASSPDTNSAGNHAHTVPAFSGTSGSTGTGTAVTHTPAHLVANFFIKY